MELSEQIIADIEKYNRLAKEKKAEYLESDKRLKSAERELVSVKENIRIGEKVIERLSKEEKKAAQTLTPLITDNKKLSSKNKELEARNEVLDKGIEKKEEKSKKIISKARSEKDKIIEEKNEEVKELEETKTNLDLQINDESIQLTKVAQENSQRKQAIKKELPVLEQVKIVLTKKIKVMREDIKSYEDISKKNKAKFDSYNNKRIVPLESKRNGLVNEVEALKNKVIEKEDYLAKIGENVQNLETRKKELEEEEAKIQKVRIVK